MRSFVAALSAAAFIICLFCAPATAARVRWVAVGPNGSQIGSGKLNAFAYVQSNPSVMYIGGGWGNTPRESPSQMGIYGTTDGGAHWTPLDNGLTNADGTISSVVNGLWLDQSNPSVLLAATEFGGTFRSTNGGASWVNVDRNESTQFAQLGTAVYLATSAGVLVSNDDGATWSVSLAVTGGASTVVAAGGTIYAGSEAGDIYQFNGSSWTLKGHPGTGPVHNIAIDPFQTKTVYANTDDAAVWNQQLYASLDGGVTWKTINPNDFSVGPQALAASAVVPHRMYVGDDGGGAIYYFTADGNPNPAIHLGAEPGQYGGVDMRYIIVAPSTSNTDDACYALEDQGLFYGSHCSSGGAPALDPQVNDTLAYDVKITSNGAHAIVPLQDNSAAASTDGGKSWFYNNSANAGEGGEAAIDPKNPSNCYFSHPDSGLWVSTDGCGSFNQTVFAGFASITFDPSTSGHLYGISDADFSNAHIVQSSNGGNTWTSVSWMTFNYPYQVAVSPSDPKTILVAAGTATSKPFLYYTHDGGTTWAKSSGLPHTIAPNATIYFPVDRFYVTFEPGAPGTILLADHDPATDDVIVYKSTDNGASFTKVHKFVQPAPSRPWPNLLFPNPDERVAKGRYYATRFYGNRLAFNPAPPAGSTPDVVLTTRFGAFLSTDAGATWHRIDNDAIPHHFVGASWSSGTLFLASFGEGVIRTTKPLQ